MHLIQFLPSKIEELASELKEKYTIVIVTHNMQQAVRIQIRQHFSFLATLLNMVILRKCLRHRRIRELKIILQEDLVKIGGF